MKLFIHMALVLLSLCFSRNALSQTVPDASGVRACPAASGTLEQKKKVAGEWYGEAVTYADQKAWPKAMRSFLCSFQQVPHSNTAYNIALAAEQLHEDRVAIVFYTEYLKYAPYAEDSKGVENRLAELNRKAAAMPPENERAKGAAEALAEGRQAEAANDYAKARDRYWETFRLAPLAADGTEVLARILAMDEVIARGEGKKPVEVAAAAPAKIVPPPAPAKPEVSPEPSAKPQPKGSDLGLRIGGWTLVGGGGALMITGAVLAVMASNRASNVENAKDGTAWSSVKGSYDSAPGLGIGAIVCMVAGAGAMIGGGYILLFEVGKPDAEKTQVGLAPSGRDLAVTVVF